MDRVAGANDVNIDAVNVVPVAGGSDVLFIDGELDCYMDFWTSGMIAGLTEDRPGEETTFFIRDSLDVYGHSMVVNNDFLEENPDAVRGFMQAYAEGMKHTADNPDDTVDMILEEFPENDRAATEWSVPKYVEPAVRRRRRGRLPAFESAGWDATLDTVVTGGLMEEEWDISHLYTMDYSAGRAGHAVTGGAARHRPELGSPGDRRRRTAHRRAGQRRLLPGAARLWHPVVLG